jgi:predicted lipid-binding transport protein (Tim44 family)
MKAGIAASASVALTLVWCASASPTRNATPTAGVEATLRAEVTAYNRSDWRALWNLRTPRFRTTCSYAKMAAAERGVRARVGTITISNIHVTVLSPTRARASYVQVTQSRSTVRTRADLFAKVGPRWLDDFDSSTRWCGYQ